MADLSSETNELHATKPPREAVWCAYAFALNIFIVQTSQLGWYGETNSEMSKRYQTFVTPAGWAFSIWAFIYLSQSAFTIYSLVASCSPHGRLVVKTITAPWISAQLFQVAWTFIFAQDMVSFSFAAMLGIYLSLFVVTQRLFSLGSSQPDYCRFTGKDFWLCHIPFQVHFGWITCASLVNFSVLLRSGGEPLHVQLTAASCTLAIASLSSLASIMYRRDAVHAFVVAWALIALSRQLALPSNPLPFSAAGEPYTEGLSGAAFALSVLSAVGAAISAFLSLMRWGEAGGEASEASRVVIGGKEGALLSDDGAALSHVGGAARDDDDGAAGWGGGGAVDAAGKNRKNGFGVPGR